jgi:hypothetical protein
MLDELKSNSRLRIGLAVAAGLVVITLLLDAQAALRAKGTEAAQAQARLLAFASRTKDTVWTDRAAEAARTRADLESRLWRAESPGAAEAAFVDWVNRELQAANATVTNVVSATVPGSAASSSKPAGPALPEGMHLLRLNVAFAFVPGTLERVLDRVLAQERFVVVESLSVKQRPVARVQLVIASVAQVGEARGGGKR